MARLQPPVVMVLDQMVIGVARKCQRVQPQRINGAFCQPRQLRAQSQQVRQVKPDDVVAQEMVRTLRHRLEPDQRLFDQPATRHHLVRPIVPHGGKGKDPCRPGVNLEVQRDTPVGKGERPLRHQAAPPDSHPDDRAASGAILFAQTPDILPR